MTNGTAGFETHPDPTPYDELVGDLLTERDKAFSKRKADKKSDSKVLNTKLFVEGRVLPWAKTTESLLMENYDEDIENEDGEVHIY